MEDLLDEHPLAFIAAVLVLIVAVAVSLSYKICMETYAAYKPTWGVWSDCRIVVGGRLTPVNMLKSVDLTKF